MMADVNYTRKDQREIGVGRGVAVRTRWGRVGEGSGGKPYPKTFESPNPSIIQEFKVVKQVRLVNTEN